MATKHLQDEEPRALDYDPAYPFKAPCEVVACAPHSFSGSGIDSVALTVRHAWVRRRESGGLVRKAPGRVTPSTHITGYTYFHTTLVTNQIGPILGHLNDNGQALIGKWVMLCGNPFQGTEDYDHNGLKCNLLYVRDAHVYVIEKPEGA